MVSKEDPIEPELRYTWLVDHYKDNESINIDVTSRDNINALPQSERTGAWCKFIKSEFPDIDCIVSSETYGDILANFLGIKHLKFDHERKITPISATKIRENFKENMNYLPEHVKVFFNK